MGGGMIMQNLQNFLRLQWVRIRIRLFVTRVLLVTGVLFITEEMSPVLKQSANAAPRLKGWLATGSLMKAQVPLPSIHRAWAIMVL
jgi:hypothetical protein